MSSTDPQQPPVSVYGGSGPSGPRASFGRRLVASLLDGILVSIVYWIGFAIGGRGLASVVGIIVSLAYFSYFEGSPSGQTIGKKALGIRVVDFATGGALGFGRGFIRWISRILSTIPCFLGYLWMLWDKEKQTWHDKIATSVVVPESAYPVSKWPG
jgi:uncharacterized RDD family membrane protein YckC